MLTKEELAFLLKLLDEARKSNICSINTEEGNSNLNNLMYLKNKLVNGFLEQQVKEEGPEKERPEKKKNK